MGSRNGDDTQTLVVSVRVKGDTVGVFVVARRYVREACDALCTRLSKSILDAYETQLHSVPDAVFYETIHHRDIVTDKTATFVGRESLLTRIMAYLDTPSTGSGRVYTVHGNSGCGKTALLAMVAHKVAQESSKSVTVVRFLGTSVTSSSARAMLRSVCQQICRVYDPTVTSVCTPISSLSVFINTNLC